MFLPSSSMQKATTHIFLCSRSFIHIGGISEDISISVAYSELSPLTIHTHIHRCWGDSSGFHRDWYQTITQWNYLQSQMWSEYTTASIQHCVNTNFYFCLFSILSCFVYIPFSSWGTLIYCRILSCHAIWL